MELKGYFIKPKSLLEATKNKNISKAEYILLDILLAYANKFRRETGVSFFLTDKEIISYKLISQTTLTDVKKSLTKKGYINIIPGKSNQATVYTPLFPFDK